MIAQLNRPGAGDPRTGHLDGDPSGMPTDFAAVEVDDALLDYVAVADRPTVLDGVEGELARLLISWRQEVHAEPLRLLADTNTAMMVLTASHVITTERAVAATDSRTLRRWIVIYLIVFAVLGAALAVL